MVHEWRFTEWWSSAGAKLLALIAVLALAVAACGGDETTAANEGVAETDASDSGEGDDSAAGDGSDAASDDDADDDAADAAEDAADDAADDAGDDAAEDDRDDDDNDDAAAGGELPNACPADGCQVEITGAEPGTGGEIQLTFEANYTPDFEQNHIHVFWDSQEPGAVSSDYAAKGFDVQGKWHPTDEYPVYETQSDASVSSASRQESTTICVTAADTDHAVIDATLYHCRDVADLLSS